MDRIKKILISSIVTFTISMLTITLLLKIYNPKSDKTNLNDKVYKKDKIQTTPNSNEILLRELSYYKRNIEIQKSLDSLNNLFIEEVTGTGLSKTAGYGRNAHKIKEKIDSLKLELDKAQITK